GFSLAPPLRAGETTATWPRGLESAEFAVRYEGDGGPQTLTTRRMARPVDGVPQWGDLQIDLAGLANRRGTLILEASAADGALSGSDVVWSAPRLITPGPPSRTNIILISIDTLRADHLGCYGSGAPTSPNIDRMAGDGVVFRTYVASTPWTLP